MLWTLQYEDEDYENYFTVGTFSTLEKAQQGIRDMLAKINWDRTMFYRYYAESVQKSINCTVINPLPVDDERIEADHFLAAEEATSMVMHEMKELYAEAYDCDPKDYGHYIIEVERNK